MPSRLPSSAPTGNRPEVFLYPAWKGAGVTCDAFGIQRDRYEVSGGGRRDPDGSAIIDYVVALESGLTNVHAWKFRPDTGDQIIARDLVSGEEIRGRVTATGFHWSTHAPMKTPFGVRRCRIDLAYDIKGSEAQSAVTVSFLGVTVATASACLRHLDAVQEDLKAAS
jgi:hypothetical protein